jgi:cell division protein FtsQ
LSKNKVNIIIGRSLLGLLIATTFVLLVGAVRSKEDKICSGLDIEIGLTDQKGFVDESEVAAVISNEIRRKVNGTPIKNFNLKQTETVLEENVWIKKAQMFFDNNEVLHVQVEQRIPVARIMDKSGASYYLDSTGFKLPLSNTDRADVPVFTSVPVKRSLKQNKTIIAIANYIDHDTFWLAQAAQINMLPMDKFELYPAFGDHIVDLGDGTEPADKFGRLKLFYKQVSAKKGFDIYPKLSVAFKGQVVAVKGTTPSPRVDAGKAMQVFDQIIKSNRRTANDEKVQEADKEKMIRNVTPGETSVSNASEQPPDIKNKGNPADDKNKTTAAPKAVMPRLNHN